MSETDVRQATGKTILIVEDDPDDEEMILHTMRKLSIANKIDVVQDGEEALKYLATSPLPQIVLLDLRLPKIDGFEVLQRIRADERTRYLPVVMLTSSDDNRDVIQSYEQGANSFVSKPVKPDEFRKAVEQLGIYWLLLNRSPVSGETR